MQHYAHAREGRSMSIRWQPIETAPKNGTIVLLFYPNAWGIRRVNVRHWSTGEWRVGGKLITEGWTDDVREIRLGEAPTHWAHIQEPQ
jgi:hypothetical protein